MSTVAQIYGIVNDVAKQTLGDNALAVIDTNSFVSLGTEVLSSSTSTDKFLSTLVDRIGKVIFSVRRYEAATSGMVRNEFEYGCVVQKIYVDLPEAKENKAWNIGDVGYTPEYAPVIKPNANQKLFNKISTWEVDVTIPDFMLRTAFTSEMMMATFIDAIFVSMDNSMEIAMENVASLTRANFIKHVYTQGTAKVTKRNLLDEYNTLTNASLTIAGALMNVDFLKWASMQMSLVARRMGRMSKIFNIENFARFTPKDRLVIDVLDDFATASSYFLQSDTYHNDLVKLPGYNTVPYWQGSGVDYDFDSVSSVFVSETSETETDAITGIVGVMYDYEALGMTITEKRSATERNNKDEYTDYFNKANIGYFNDLSENFVVFYMAEV